MRHINFKGSWFHLFIIRWRCQLLLLDEENRLLTMCAFRVIIAIVTPSQPTRNVRVRPFLHESSFAFFLPSLFGFVEHRQPHEKIDKKVVNARFSSSLLSTSIIARRTFSSLSTFFSTMCFRLVSSQILFPMGGLGARQFVEALNN